MPKSKLELEVERRERKQRASEDAQARAEAKKERKERRIRNTAFNRLVRDLKKMVDIKLDNNLECTARFEFRNEEYGFSWHSYYSHFRGSDESPEQGWTYGLFLSKGSEEVLLDNEVPIVEAVISGFKDLERQIENRRHRY